VRAPGAAGPGGASVTAKQDAEVAKSVTEISVEIDTSPETLVRAWMLALRHVCGGDAERAVTPPEMLSAFGTISAIHAFARAVCSSHLPPEVVDATDRAASAHGEFFGNDYVEFERSEDEAEAASAATGSTAQKH